MGLITDIFFGLGYLFKWSFETLLVPIGYWAGWFFTFVGFGFMFWWMAQIVKFGSEDKAYDGI